MCELLLTLPGLFLRQMMASDTAAYGAQNRMMARIMARDAAGHGPREATDRQRRRRRQRPDHCDDDKRTFDFHDKFPFGAAIRRLKQHLLAITGDPQRDIKVSRHFQQAMSALATSELLSPALSPISLTNPAF
jgi:hypothetical protein